MTSVINSNKIAFFLLVLVIVGLLTVLAFAFVANAGGLDLDIAGISTMRYCVSSGGVCTGV